MDTPIIFICNDEEIHTSLHPSMPLLDFLRKEINLTGTREGCREGDCGACTILLGDLNNDKVVYSSVNSCLLPLGAINGKHVVTIEGLNSNGLSPLQQAIIDEGAVQCGFCTPGIIVSFTGYLLSNYSYSAEEAINHIAGNICRCTGYASIKRAAAKVINAMEGVKESTNHLEFLINNCIIPGSFSGIPQKLKALRSSITLPGEDHNEIMVAGGTDVFVQKRYDLPLNIGFIPTVPEPGKIILQDKFCCISSTATATDISNSSLLTDLIPGIKSYLKFFGSLPIRNRATLGGNIANASPIGDMTILFMALDSILIIRNGEKTREIPLKDFYLGYKKLNKDRDEIIEALKFPVPQKPNNFNFEKVSRRQYLDIASVNSAIYFETDGRIITRINISAGGVAPVPMLLEKTAQFLSDREITPGNIRIAAAIARSEISPVSDVRGSAEYKSLLLQQLILAHFLKFFPELVNEGELLTS